MCGAVDCCGEEVLRSRRAVVLSCHIRSKIHGWCYWSALRREPLVQRIEGVFPLKNNPTKIGGESQAKVRWKPHGAGILRHAVYLVYSSGKFPTGACRKPGRMVPKSHCTPTRSRKIQNHRGQHASGFWRGPHRRWQQTPG